MFVFSKLKLFIPVGIFAIAIALSGCNTLRALFYLNKRTIKPVYIFEGGKNLIFVPTFKREVEKI